MNGCVEVTVDLPSVIEVEVDFPVCFGNAPSVPTGDVLPIVLFKLVNPDGIGWEYTLNVNGYWVPENLGATSGESSFSLIDEDGDKWVISPNANGNLITENVGPGTGSRYRAMEDFDGNIWLIGIDTQGGFTRQQL